MPDLTLPQGTISYRDTGDGPPVVFLHGLLVDGRVWRKVTPLLDEDHRSIVPTLPLGSARSASPAWSSGSSSLTFILSVSIMRTVCT